MYEERGSSAEMGQTEQRNRVRSRTALAYLHLNRCLDLWWSSDLQPLFLKGPAQQPRAQKRCSKTTAPADSHGTGVPCAYRQSRASWGAQGVNLKAPPDPMCILTFPCKGDLAYHPETFFPHPNKGRGQMVTCQHSRPQG